MAIDAAWPAQPDVAPAGARLASDLTDVDLTDARAFREHVPHDAFDRLRSAGGVTWHEETPPPELHSDDLMLKFVPSPGFWSVTSHQGVSTVLRDQGTFSSAMGTVILPSLAPESLDMFRSMMLNMDPPEHSRLRRILQPIFTPKAVQRLHESVQRNAVEIVDALDGQQDCDLVTAVSAEMPLLVLADLLGMPSTDRHLIFEWSNGLLGVDDPGKGADPGRAIAAVGEMMAYGHAMAEDRRAEPRDDVVSRIVHAEVDGERLDETEFSMFWLLLVIAGNETTRNALSGSVIALQENDRWDWLVEHRDQLPVALEELLRYVSPVMQFRRTATRDVTLGDQSIRAGDKVVVWYGAGNRDPSVFTDPHRLDLQRDPNPHLAFGVGPHFCLGAHLARLELTTMLDELLSRYPSLRIGGYERSTSNFINGISTLPVRLEA